MKLITICFIFAITTIFSIENPKTFLVFGGKTGWIGQKVVKLLQDQNHHVHCANSRLENRESIQKEIENICPDFIINCAGITGNPNVDWCEDHQIETVRTNIIGVLTLVDIAHVNNIHVTNFGTGCIYEYNETHPMNSGIGFSEEDPPNFSGSFYSYIKGIFEKFIPLYPNLLNLRLRMPISSDLHPKNFITKITKYNKVINIPNSMSILDDLLPAAIDMTLRKVKGNFNFVNPGVISHNEVLDLYTQYIDPNFKYKNFTIEEQNIILKAKRSNNELNTNKLLNECPYILPIQEAIKKTFQQMEASLSKS